MVDLDLSGEPAASPPAARPLTLARVLDAVRGLAVRRAVVALLAAALSGTLVGGLLLISSAVFGQAVAFFAAFVVGLAVAAGVHAAGLLQMDAARGIGQRSVADALTQGVQALPMLIVVALCVLATLALVFVAIALLLAITKLPFLGPLLFVVAFPLAVVVAGVALWGAALALAFAFGALWQGASPIRALAQTIAVLRHRPVDTLLRFVALGFVGAAAAAVVVALLFAGVGPVAGLAANIIGFGPVGVGDPAALGAGGAFGPMRNGATGHAAAGAIGAMLLWAVALSLVAQVWLRGVSDIYLDMSQGVDASASEARLRDGIEEARRRAAAATAIAMPSLATPGSAAPGNDASGTATAAAPAPSPTPPPPDAVPPWDESTSPAAASSAGFERRRGAALAATPPGVIVDPVTLPLFPARVDDPPRAADIDLPLDAADDTDGAPLHCPHCQAAVAADDVYCNACGTKLAPEMLS